MLAGKHNRSLLGLVLPGRWRRGRDENQAQNLKKVLSLVLCVAMMLSVMVVGAGAAFSDQSKIKNTEAVDACTALNIIGGYPDGSFKPEGNITRAEVTKMICVALNGGKEPNLATNATPTFSDVRTNANSAWAEKYIESCYAQGIVSGVGAGKFAPAGNVTGTQLAKMLLVALGYKSENEGFTGNAWATNVNTIASAKGLYAGLEKMDVSAALTRDSAARMIWNALQAYEVEYKTTLTTDKNGQLTSQITVQDKVVGSNNDKITLLRDKYDAWVNVGTLVGVSSNEITLTMSDADQTASDLVNYIGTGSNRYPDPTIKFSKLTTDYSALIGQRVKVIFKNGKVNDVLGVYATSDNTVYNTLMNKVELDGSKIKFDGKSYSTELLGSTASAGAANNTTGNALITIVDGKLVNGYALSKFDDTAENKTSINEVTFVDSDDNGKIDTAIITTKTSAKVTYASSSEIVAGETYKYEDENIDKDFAKDDYAVISENLYKDCKNVVKAQVLNDTIKGYKSKTGYVQYQIGSTWYNAQKQFTDVDTGDKVKAYAYNGVVFDISADNSNGALPSIAVVTGLQGAGSTLYGDQVKLTFLDGTTKVVALDKVVKVDASTKKETAIKPTIGTAYSYTSSKDGYKLTQLENKKYNDYQALEVITDFANYSNNITSTGGSQNGVDFNETAGTLTVGTTAYKVADSAVVVMVQASGKVKVITGKQYNSLTDSKAGYVTAAFTKKVDGLNKVAILAAYVNDVDATGKSNDKYAYIVSAGYKTGDNYTSYTIWTGEKNVEVTEKVNYATTGENARLKGMVVGYSDIDADGYINDVNAYTATAASGTLDTTHMYYGGIQGVSGTSWVTVDGENKLNITKDTKILNIDSAADKDEEIGKQGTALLTAQEIASSGKYYVNAYYILDETFGSNDNADLAFIVVDLKGKMDGKNEVKNTTEDPAVTLVAGTNKISVATIDASKLEAGKTYDLLLTTSENTTSAAVDVNVTLTGAVFASDGKSTTQKVTFAQGKNAATVKVIATGSAVTVKGA